MEPLIALTAVTTVLFVIGVVGVPALWPVDVPLRYGLATMFTMTGLAHFVGMRDELIRMVPPALPAPGVLVTITGLLELAGAVGLVLRRTALASAAALTVLMVLMFPANVHAARAGLTDDVSDQLLPRTAMEAVFIAATTTVVVCGWRRRRQPTTAVWYLPADPDSSPPSPETAAACAGSPPESQVSVRS